MKMNVLIHPVSDLIFHCHKEVPLMYQERKTGCVWKISTVELHYKPQSSFIYEIKAYRMNVMMNIKLWENIHL